MKAIIKLAFFSLFALNATIGTASNTSTKEVTCQTTIDNTKYLTQQEANALVKRVYTIRAIDVNTLSDSEKRNIKNELQSIRQKLTDPLAGGIYISTGVLVLIIVLLIIF